LKDIKRTSKEFDNNGRMTYSNVFFQRGNYVSKVEANATFDLEKEY